MYYTVTGEIALARGVPRIAAFQYAAAAQGATDLADRARERGDERVLAPPVDRGHRGPLDQPGSESPDAHRAAAQSALAIPRTEPPGIPVVRQLAARHEAELKELETELEECEDVFRAASGGSARDAFPELRRGPALEGFAALRRDDPAAAPGDFSGASPRRRRRPDARRVQHGRGTP